MMDVSERSPGLETDTVEADAVEEEDSSVGTLGAAFLQAGFGADGTKLSPEELPETPEEETPEEEEGSLADELPEWARRSSPPPDEDPDPWGSAFVADEAEAALAEAEASQPPSGSEEAWSSRKGVAPRSDRSEGAAPPVLVEPEPEPVEAEEDQTSPFDLPGDWFVINSYSGHEKKVKANLATRTTTMHMEDRIFDVVIPTEKVVEIKAGRKEEVERKMFPGYLLVRMYMDDDSWLMVRNTPGVTAFVGSGTKPVPLSRREVERFLGLKKEASKKPPRFKPAWEIGETVRVVAGPFADFNGIVEDINVDQQKVTVLVEIFGRDTPTELGFEDIQKQ